MRDDRHHYESLDRRNFRKNEQERYSLLYRPFRNDDINEQKQLYLSPVGIQTQAILGSPKILHGYINHDKKHM